MREASSLRRPSFKERVLIVGLALYALAVVGPDTLRPFISGGDPHDGRACGRWYPLGTLGFEADNDGLIVAVEPDGPADHMGLRKDQRIALSSVQPDRRAINKLVYVAPCSVYTIPVVSGPATPFEWSVSVPAVSEDLGGWKAKGALLTAQLSAVAFILLCVYLIWHNATWSSWGFFLYGMWFNSGQYFFWYANLPRIGLIVFDALQAVVQALALTGFLTFALHFPDEKRPQWLREHRLYLLGGAWAVLFVFGGLAFLNFVLGWRTELLYRIYFASTFGVYLVAGWLFVTNYRKLPEQRPRMRWIMVASLSGLLCFLLADVYEATGLFRNLPFGINEWVQSHDWVLNLMYSCNLLVPAAVVYTARRQEVMSIRIGITRGVVLTIILACLIAGLEEISKLPVEKLEQHEEMKPLALPIALLSAIGLCLVHSPLDGLVECVCAPRWHRARRRLHELTERLLDDDGVTEAEVDEMLVDETTTALRLRCCALFCRLDDGRFVIQRHANWPADSKQALLEDDAWMRSVRTEPVPVVDADGDLSGTALVMPIARRNARQPTRRIVLYGDHLTGEQIDPEEVRILHEMSRAAAVAYLRLELETAADRHNASLSTTAKRSEESGNEDLFN